MASLGFRPPQFSEDLAWLPDWLQFDLNQIECTEEDRSSKEVSVFRSRGIEGNDADWSDRDGVGYSNCRLHWSGESNSPTNVTQSTGNVLHINLNFSLDSDLECIKSQVPTASQPLIQSVKCSSSQRSETTAETVEIDSPSRGEEKQSCRYFEEFEVDDAVEFYIAASEAVIIHELVESEPALECLAMPTVVEITLRVKQARLEGLQDKVDDRTEQTIDECSPLEMDNFMMMDAFKDVGLSSNDYDVLDSSDLDVSLVKETPVVADHEGHITGSEAEEKRNDRVRTSDVHPPKQLDEIFYEHRQLEEHLPLERMVNDTDMQGDVPGYVTPNPSISILPIRADKLPRQSPEKVSCSLMKEKRVGLTEFAETTSQPHSDLSLTTCHQLDGQNYAMEKRFKSRWLGGWSKDVVNATVKPKEHRSFGNLFRGETSLLSESADIAPDENSVVQEHKTKRTEMASNVPSHSSCDKPSDGELFFEEVVRSSCLSLVDPLCSVVPCSISVEDPESLQLRPQDTEDVSSEKKSSSPALCLGLPNLCNTSDQEMNIKLQKSNLSITDDGSQTTVKRQVSCLKNYSSFIPEGLSHFGSKVDSSSLAKLNRRIRASHADRNCTRSLSTSGLTSAISIATYTVRKNGKKQVSRSLKQNDKEMAGEKRAFECMEGAGTGAHLLQPPAKNSLPLIFGPRKKCRIQVPKFPAENSTESDKVLVLQANADKVQERGILQNKHLECQKTIENQLPGKKKVRFAEANTILQKDMPIRNLKSSRKNGVAAEPNKKSEYLSLELESRTQRRKNLSRCTNSRNRLIFQGVEFLITGFSRNKEKEIEGLIHRHGGVVLLDIPSIKSRGKRSVESPLQQQPVVISPKKLKTDKFLYGCAVGTLILKFIWLTDSISAGATIPPEKYMVIPNQSALANYGAEEPISQNKNKRIFEQVGIMLHGKCSFYAKFTSIITHGGGQAFKTLQQLLRSLDDKKLSLGIIVTEYESKPSRHLRQCAMERNIPIMPISWIIQSLYVGKLQLLSS